MPVTQCYLHHADRLCDAKHVAQYLLVPSWLSRRALQIRTIVVGTMDLSEEGARFIRMGLDLAELTVRMQARVLENADQPGGHPREQEMRNQSDHEARQNPARTALMRTEQNPRRSAAPQLAGHDGSRRPSRAPGLRTARDGDAPIRQSSARRERSRSPINLSIYRHRAGEPAADRPRRIGPDTASTRLGQRQEQPRPSGNDVGGRRAPVDATARPRVRLDGRGTAAPRQTTRPTRVLCSVHRKQRSSSVMVPDEHGGYRCRRGHSCKRTEVRTRAQARMAQHREPQQSSRQQQGSEVRAPLKTTPLARAGGRPSTRPTFGLTELGHAVLQNLNVDASSSLPPLPPIGIPDQLHVWSSGSTLATRSLAYTPPTGLYVQGLPGRITKRVVDTVYDEVAALSPT